MRAAGSKISVVAALLVVSTACAPNYFPPLTFEVNEESDALMRDWYSDQLYALREPVIFDKEHENRTSYRFTWLRTFHRPIAVRVEVDAEGVGTLHFKVADGHGGYDPGQLETSRQRTLTPGELEDFERLFNDADICNMPPKPEDYFVVVTDGSAWVFEFRRGNEYCAIELRLPGPNKYSDIGIRLLELAGFEASEDDPIY